MPCWSNTARRFEAKCWHIHDEHLIFWVVTWCGCDTRLCPGLAGGGWSQWSHDMPIMATLRSLDTGHTTDWKKENSQTSNLNKCFVVYWFLWFCVTNVQKLGYKVGCVMVWQFPQFSPMQSRSVGKYYRTIIERVIVITCRPPVNGVFHIIKWEWELD